MLRNAAVVLLTLVLQCPVAIPATVAQNANSAKNLAPNPGMEQMTGERLQLWALLNMGAPAELAVDLSVKRSGMQSVRVSAKEVTRSYAHSGAILVAPGEKITVSAWVKVNDVPAEQGTVIAIAEFSRGEGTKESVSKIGTAKVGPGAPTDWQQISGAVEVPADAMVMRLRLGFSYSSGTCWWDDVTVTAERPLACLTTFAGQRVSPGLDGIAVKVINRDGTKGPMTVCVSLGKEKADAKLELDGHPGQSVTVPLKITARGATELKASILRGETEIATHTRKVTVPKEGMDLLPLIPTHWAVEDGNPRVAGEVDLFVPKAQREGGVLTATIVDASGKAHATWSSEGGAVVDGINAFSLSGGAMKVGDYKVVLELKPRKGEVIRAERAWSIIPRSKARVTINGYGYPVHDGKAIFPLGVFNGMGRMSEPDASGFTVTHAYNVVEAEVGGRMDDAKAALFLDNTLAGGRKAVMLVPRQLVFAENWDGVRRRVRMFRNHPGLLAWDEEEGLARGDIKIGTLARLRQILCEEDPNHPLMVGDAKDVIGRIEPTRRDLFPVEHMDLGMWWWYPIPLAPAKADALEGDEGKPGTDELAPPSFLVNRATDKPIWCGVQSYKKKTGRYPTPTEYRAQAYIALLHGAKGLMWYGGSVTGGAYLNVEESNWTYVKKLGAEMNEMASVFMSETQATPKFSPENAPVSVMLRKSGEQTVLIAVNRGAKPVEVVFDSPAINAGAIKVLYENRDVATAKAGKLLDKFEPYAVHVYELKR